VSVGSELESVGDEGDGGVMCVCVEWSGVRQVAGMQGQRE